MVVSYCVINSEAV